MENNDSLVLNELAESGSALRPSVQVEHALAEIKDTYQSALFVAAHLSVPIGKSVSMKTTRSGARDGKSN